MTGAGVGSNILAADFSVRLFGKTGVPTHSVDLYYNRVSNLNNIVASDYENGTLLMSNFVGPTSPNNVPEPSGIALFGIALLGIGHSRRK